MERKAASAFFATPPESSYEEALGYMLNAAKHREGWIRAAQMVGECYAKLNVRQTSRTDFSWNKTPSHARNFPSDEIGGGWFPWPGHGKGEGVVREDGGHGVPRRE